MKVSKKESAEAFNPIVVELTFETQDEWDAFRSVFQNSDICTSLREVYAVHRMIDDIQDVANAENMPKWSAFLKALRSRRW